MTLEDKNEIAGRAKCECVHHAEDGIPCHHDIALALEEDTSWDQYPECPECPDGGLVDSSSVGGDWYCYECCNTF